MDDHERAASDGLNDPRRAGDEAAQTHDRRSVHEAGPSGPPPAELPSEISGPPPAEPSAPRAAELTFGPAASTEAVTQDEPRADGGTRSFARELPFLIVVALALALVIKALLVQAFYIPSESMQQTLERRDRVLVNKLGYRFGDVQRGDVVVFDGDGSFTGADTSTAPPAGAVQRGVRAVGATLGLSATGEKDFIKRVIGIAGDRVACCDPEGRVTVLQPGAKEPVPLTEPYVYSAAGGTEPFCAAGLGEQTCPPGSPGVEVPAGRIWVMGDHRDASQDSRAYLDNDDNGTVPVEQVIGRAFVIVWPLERSTLLRGPSTFDRLADSAE